MRISKRKKYPTLIIVGAQGPFLQKKTIYLFKSCLAVSSLEGQEGIVLLSSGTSLRLEPVCEMGRTLVHGPDTDCVSDRISSALVQRLTTTHLAQELGIGRLGEGLGDLGQTEDTLAKELGRVDGLAVLGRVGDVSTWTKNVVADSILAGLVSSGRHFQCIDCSFCLFVFFCWRCLYCVL